MLFNFCGVYFSTGGGGRFRVIVINNVHSVFRLDFGQGNW
ncbi:hypothetical protein D1BOALGB6SA_6223 [Olavius sp. associated proteobacterium Delta 1]|nr:hypothetical protein D1BOALGB6SA_6223 [Olavius sp. associated proteobacterium Delta 1]